MQDKAVASGCQGSYVVITPVRDEAGYIGKTIDSMARQVLRPLQWVIVDDGSRDGTGDILNTAARHHSWITAVRRSDRGFRKPGGGVVEAFYDGYAALKPTGWDFIVKLDGDLSFEPDYFKKCLTEFSRDSKLGIAGGTINIPTEGRLQVDCPNDPPFHVRGATKIYRRACWEQIAPLVAAPGWDTIDEVRANMHGWCTRTFKEIQLLQHRTTGAVNGDWATSLKDGLGSYVTGYHPLFMLAKCVKYLWASPRASAGLFAGYCSGYMKRQPHSADERSIQYLRQQQLRYLLLRPGIYGQAWKRN